MKITTSKENFVKEIQTIQSGMNAKNSTMPILQNFLLETEEDGVRISFTDLEMAVKHFIPLTVVEHGSVTVPIKKFMEIVTNLRSKEEITISSDESFRITLQSGKSRIKMGGTKKDEYPAIPEIENGISFSLPAIKAAEMINATLFSASNEEDRPNLTGLLWKYKEGVFSVVATDGRRLAIKTTSSIQCSQEFSVIVPSKIMNELTKYIKSAGIKDDAIIQVSVSSNQIGFQIGKTYFMSRLTEGTYPAYEQIIPQTHEVEARIDSDALLAVTKSASICTMDGSRKVKYSFSKGILTVNSSSQNMDFEDELPLSYEGEDFQISFNPFFIMDILKNVPAGEIILQFKTPTTPALLKTAAEETPLYIVMPLR